MSYRQLSRHRLMLQDQERCQVYRQAIDYAVKPGDVVLDAGAGTAILSLFALRAGAQRVYAAERTGIAEFARQLVTLNEGEDRIEVVQGEMADLDLPEKVDVIVSEWMGGFGIDEDMLGPVLRVRDRWLKQNGVMLPERVTAWLAPVWDQQLDAQLSFYRSDPYGVDLTPVASGTTDEILYGRHHVLPEHLAAEPQQMWSTDTYTCSVQEAEGAFQASMSFVIARPGQLNALATWFRAQFMGGFVLTNAPDAPPTHWGRWIFPLKRTIAVERGSSVEVNFTSESAEPGWRETVWWVRVGNSPWEHHDTRRAYW
jgi:type I protein arginine methyltransferase